MESREIKGSDPLHSEDPRRLKGIEITLGLLFSLDCPWGNLTPVASLIDGGLCTSQPVLIWYVQTAFESFFQTKPYKESSYRHQIQILFDYIKYILMYSSIFIKWVTE